jgi:hypothetical protein
MYKKEVPNYHPVRRMNRNSSHRELKWYQIIITPVCSPKSSRTANLNHRLKQKSGGGGEHGASATNDLDGRAGERRKGGRRGGGGHHGHAGGGRGGNGAVAGAVAGDGCTGRAEVGAGNAALVGQVEHERQVAEVGRALGVGGGVRVSVPEKH